MCIVTTIARKDGVKFVSKDEIKFKFAYFLKISSC